MLSKLRGLPSGPDRIVRNGPESLAATRGVRALLDADQHERGTASLELSAPPEPGLGSVDPGIVDLNLSMEWFARRIDHRPPELVEHQPGSVVQNRPGRQRHLVSAGGALPASAFNDGIGVPVPASGAGEALGLPTHRQVFLAGLFSRELTLKFGKISRKGRARCMPYTM